MPIDCLEVPCLGLSAEPLAPSGPCNPEHFIVAGCYFLCREIEIAEARVSHLTFSSSAHSVTWMLPASKTDVRALGTTRSWGCVCGGDPTIACPYHALMHQHAFAMQQAKDLGNEVADSPLFPTRDGTRVTKEAAVATITAVASAIGLPTVCPSSNGQLFGGHSMRTGGAQTLAGLGVDPIRIQAMGRWRSSLVIRYSGNKGSSGITTDTVRGLANRSTSSASLPLRIPDVGLGLLVDGRGHLEHEARIMQALADSTAMPPLYIENQTSGVIHKASAVDKTLCGMAYSNWSFRKHNSIPMHVSYNLLCTRCCRHERNDSKPLEVLSSDSD